MSTEHPLSEVSRPEVDHSKRKFLKLGALTFGSLATAGFAGPCELMPKAEASHESPKTLEELASSGAQLTLDNNPETSVSGMMSEDMAKRFVPARLLDSAREEVGQTETVRPQEPKRAAEALQGMLLRGIREGTAFARAQVPQTEDVLPNIQFFVTTNVAGWTEGVYSQLAPSVKNNSQVLRQETKNRRHSPAFSAGIKAVINLDPEALDYNGKAMESVYITAKRYADGMSAEAFDFCRPVEFAFALHAAHEALHRIETDVPHDQVYERTTLALLAEEVSRIAARPDLVKDPIVADYCKWLVSQLKEYRVFVAELRKQTGRRTIQIATRE